jgi:nucleoside-diphosphate-sugar epimerase
MNFEPRVPVAGAIPACRVKCQAPELAALVRRLSDQEHEVLGILSRKEGQMKPTQALWCEQGGHSFSEKDPDVQVLTISGRSRWKSHGPAAERALPWLRSSSARRATPRRPSSRPASRAGMRYLVTGGAGFLGSNLVKQLVAEGHEVTVLDDMSRGQSRRLDGVNCKILSGDIRDLYWAYRAMAGCDAVVHMAYLQGTQTFYAEPRQVLDVAVRGMLAVLDACEKTGCAQMLLVSSSEAYQVASVVPTPEDIPLTVPDVTNPRYSYGGGKIACELMALAWQRTGVLDRLVIARPHNIYGPDMGWEHVIPEFCDRMNQLVQARHEGPIPFPIQGTGQETRSFCYIDDCTDQLGVLCRPDTPNGIYHVGTMDEQTIAAVAHGVAYWYKREIKIIPGTLPKGSPPRRLPDTAKITALAGKPKQLFDDGLLKTVEWYRANAR